METHEQLIRRCSGSSSTVLMTWSPSHEPLLFQGNPSTPFSPAPAYWSDTVEHFSEKDAKRSRCAALYKLVTIKRTISIAGLLSLLLLGSLATLLVQSLTDHPVSQQGDFTLSDNGHLYVSHTAFQSGLKEHPIHALMRNASKEWQEKNARQSKTYKEAVSEYQRRYQRSPPVHFDKWYEFAKENQVPLIDEYDSIFESLLPFFSLPRDILLERQSKLSKEPWTHTITVRSGKVGLKGAHAQDIRAIEQADLMRDFAQWLPDIDIVMSAHDGPATLMDYELYEEHREAASSRRMLSRARVEQVNNDAALHGWALSCPPNSNLVKSMNGLYPSRSKSAMNFIVDHKKTMDLCSNPEWQQLHGFTSWQGARPVPLQPLFSFSRSASHRDILAVPLEQYKEGDIDVQDPEWDEKPFNKLVWRGSTTGVLFARDTAWRSSQRARLSFLMNSNKSGSADICQLHHTELHGHSEVISEEHHLVHACVERYLDFDFAAQLAQCAPEDCSAIARHIHFNKAMNWVDQNNYRYILDVDGNAWSGRYHRLLRSNSVILKSTIFPEWYQERIEPWLHYVPVKIDYSDLFDIMAFFSGDLQGQKGHEQLAKRIASEGKHWALTHWRKVDMQAYTFRLYLEWARLSFN